MIAIGTTLNQRFTLDKELGRGGMGAVYRATDLVLGRTVAIKTLKDSSGENYAKKIRLEAQILARLLHENIVRLYDFGETNGTYFLVMEEVDGTSFSKRWRNVPLGARLRLNAQVAVALNYAHHQGVIHRDVKPANVLLTALDQAKLSDFGLSTMAEAMDESGTIRGTPHYMSPEQARGKRLDHRTDLYSLGVMVYECVTGSVPFSGQSMAVIAQHVSATPTPPRFKNPEISASLEALIMSLLAKNPDERPVSGDLVAKALLDEADIEAKRGSRSTGEAHSIGATEDLGRSDSNHRNGREQGLVRGLIDTASGTGHVKQNQPDSGGRTAHSKSSFDATPTPASASGSKSGPRSSTPSISASVSKVSSPLAREMLAKVLSEPISLTPDDRYYCGHYLAYLLGGARRKGLFLSRPFDPRNADRARLMLAMTWLSNVGATEESIAIAAELLDKFPDIRAALNPVVVMKYLACRETPQRRKRFRAARKQLQEASTHGRKAMLDSRGNLNPGLMPQTIEDLKTIAPDRDEVDDELVGRWNRVTEVWRENADFRDAVLRYATKTAYKDPASADLWPEVVYPLIERARWQRQFRPRHEMLWDYVSANVLGVPDAGVKLDRLIIQAVPEKLVAELDLGFDTFEDDPVIDDDPAAQSRDDEDRLSARIVGRVRIQGLDDPSSKRDKSLIPFTPVDPFRFSQGELRDLWNESMASLAKGGGVRGGHRLAPIGPYRLVVIPSVRGRSAGQIAIQGMANKQIEMITPSIRTGGSSSKLVVAAWVYQDGSMVVVYLDFMATTRYIFWHAPNAQQTNYEDPADLNHLLFTLGMEIPDQLDRVLTKKFRPSKPV